MSNDQLPKGYKLTEVGVIPEDWEVNTFGKLYVEPSRNGIYKSAEYQGRGIRIVNMGEMFGLDFISDQEMNRISLTSKEIAITRLHDGDLLFGRRSVVPAGAGKCSIVITPLEPMTFESSIIRVRLNKAEVSPLFYYYYFASSLGRSVMKNIISGTNIKGIRGTELRELKILLPPLPEQRSIATILSDIDALLESFDRLLTKKRHLKQATMQQILTGKKRLPGFDEEWEVKRFGEVTTPRKERVDPKRGSVQEFCIELEHIEQATGILIGSTSTGENASLKSVFYKGDVLFGKLRAYLRKYWLADCMGVCSTEIWVFAPNPKLITANYLFQTVKVDQFIEAASMAYGTHMPRSDWSVVKNYEIPLPPLPEQTAIATVLSDMDAEISAIEQRRTKTRALKQGMMQELLTGRVRIVD